MPETSPSNASSDAALHQASSTATQTNTCPQYGVSPQKLARARRKQPVYDRVKDILCRFAQALEKEEYHEQTSI